MRPARLAFLLFAAALAGCGPVLSLYPLVGPKDGVEVAGVEGRWRDAEGAVCEVVRDSVAYRLTWTGPTDTARVVVRFAREGDLLLADIAGVGVDGELVLPAHYVARARVAGDSLRLDLLSEDWVKQHRGPFWHRVRTAEPSGSFVLTEPTADLRRYAARAARADAAFAEWLSLHRDR